MTIYAVFDRNANEVPAVVPDRFSWFAALLPPLFALVHGLWLELVAYVLAVMLLGAANVAIGHAAAFWVYVVFAVWIGFEAPAFRRAGLRGRGWRQRAEIIAAGDDLAQLDGLKSRSAP